MINALKFVKGAVAKRGTIPELQHFKIKNGLIQSYNGSLALCSPINIDIDCIPQALPMLKAINKCTDTITLNLTKGNKLAIKSGKFSAYIPCLDPDTSTELLKPSGDKIEIDGEKLLTVLRLLINVVGINKDKIWSTGIMFKDGSAYATNNAIVIQYWTDKLIPMTCNIPACAVKELLRIKTPPAHVKINDNTVSFLYDDGRWVCCQLLTTDWPDVTKLLEKTHNAKTINPEIFVAADSIKDFCNEINGVYFKKNTISATVLHGETSASYNIDNFNFEGAYNYDVLMSLKKCNVQTIDFSTYPEPCIFYGDNFRGAIIGLKT